MRSNHTAPVVNRKEPLILGLGDLVLMAFSLWAALVFRYGHMPSTGLIEAHQAPFMAIFAVSLITFYITGLYGRAIHVTRSYIPGMVIRAQIVNAFLAVFILYFFPNFSVSPKTNLVIYIALSTLFIILWRLNTYSLLSLRRKTPAFVIGVGEEVDELVSEMNYNPRVGLFCRAQLKVDDAPEKIFAAMDTSGGEFQYVVADMDDPRIESILPELYRRFFAKARIIDLHELYEEIFDRIPLSRMDHAWIMSEVSSVSPKFYDLVKRIVDIVFSITIGVFVLVITPFVALAIKLEDRGSVFITQERVGKDGKPIKIIKFRSMTSNDGGRYLEGGKSVQKVTRIGKFIRLTRIDELPQLWSVIKGDQSLIGPRPELPALTSIYDKEIPYYSARHLIKPGLSGWAQIYHRAHPHHAVAVDDTRDKLSYDLFYLKNRSIMLDFKIALQTLRALISKQGV